MGDLPAFFPLDDLIWIVECFLEPPDRSALLIGATNEISSEEYRKGTWNQLVNVSATLLSESPEAMTEKLELGKRHDFGALTVLSGRSATEMKFFELATNRRFVHLAVHGRPDRWQSADTTRLELWLSGSPEPDADGYIGLSDLLERGAGRLLGCELVTLSACATHAGELDDDEGVWAITMGFLYAGADAVITTAWPVDDGATALLMRRLYQNLVGSFEATRMFGAREYKPGEPMLGAIALAEAKRWIRSVPDSALANSGLLGGHREDKRGPVRSDIKSYADPYFWAAFQFVGRN